MSNTSYWHRTPKERTAIDEILAENGMMSKKARAYALAQLRDGVWEPFSLIADNWELRPRKTPVVEDNNAP